MASPGPVCVVTTSYPSNDGDASGHFVKAEVLELERAGHEVTVVTPRPGGAFGWPGVASRLRASPLRAVEAAGWLLRAAAQITEAKPSRIIAHWSVPSAWPAVMMSRAGGVPLEIVSHGGDVRLLVGMPASVRGTMMRGMLSRAATWRFVSASLRDHLLAAIEPAHAVRLRAIARVAPSPITMLDVEADVQRRRRTLGDRPLYVCAGRLVPSKRVDRVIDYVAGLRSESPILVVLGDGPERARLERVALRWRIDVRFLGNTPRREALTWIGAADELVHASVAEGVSTVVREAESLGVKVTIL
ncbi:MAG: hypothetical protein JWP97_6345 [Labilithrix sp.]|nr:hypothetical protein [Labilithrix sp.]